MSDAESDDVILTDENETSEDEDSDIGFSLHDYDVPVHPFLREDIKMAAKQFADNDDLFGMDSVAFEDSDAQESFYAAVRLSFPTTKIEPQILRVWGLTDVPIVTVLVDRVHKDLFRAASDLPTVRVCKARVYEGYSSFAVGQQLHNYTLAHIGRSYRLTETTEAKDPKELGSIFAFLYQLIENRLTTLTEYCMVCDEPLTSGGVLPSVCDRPLCTYQYNELSLFSGVSIPRVSPDVLSLLIFAFYQANTSYRRGDILTPPPNIKDMKALQNEIVFDCNYEPFKAKRLKNPQESAALNWLVEGLPCPRDMLSSATSYQSFAKDKPNTARFIEWLTISNKSYLERVPNDLAVDFLGTSHQFLFVSDSPAKQREFEDLVISNGGNTRYFFHGSPIDNWHSIIRSGLKNMSNTKFMLVGAAYGAGIYLSTDIRVSLGYANRQPGSSEAIRRACKDGKCCSIVAGGVSIVAVVEVVDCADAYKGHGDIYVAPLEQYCSIRMLLIYGASACDQLGGYYGRRGGQVNAASGQLFNPNGRTSTQIGRLDSLSDSDRTQVHRVVQLFKTAGISDRVRLHVNGTTAPSASDAN